MHALLVVDMQRGFAHAADAASRKATMRAVTSRRYDVVLATRFVFDAVASRNFVTQLGWSGFDHPDDEALIPELVPFVTDTIDRHGYTLPARAVEDLRARGITHVTLAGWDMDACVYVIALQLFSEGVAVTVLEQACSTSSPRIAANEVLALLRRNIGCGAVVPGLQEFVEPVEFAPGGMFAAIDQDLTSTPALARALRRGLRQRLREIPRPVVLLSGGVASTVVAQMVPAGTPAVTLALEGSEDARRSVEIARRLCLDHHLVTCDDAALEDSYQRVRAVMPDPHDLRSYATAMLWDMSLAHTPASCTLVSGHGADTLLLGGDAGEVAAEQWQVAVANRIKQTFAYDRAAFDCSARMAGDRADQMLHAYQSRKLARVGLRTTKHAVRGPWDRDKLVLHQMLRPALRELFAAQEKAPMQESSGLLGWLEHRRAS